MMGRSVSSAKKSFLMPEGLKLKRTIKYAKEIADICMSCLIQVRKFIKMSKKPSSGLVLKEKLSPINLGFSLLIYVNN